MNKTAATPLRAIRMKCIDCMCGQLSEIKTCTISRCPLHPFRMGSNPYRAKREYTPDEIACLKARLNKNKNTGKEFIDNHTATLEAYNKILENIRESNKGE